MARITKRKGRKGYTADWRDAYGIRSQKQFALKREAEEYLAERMQEVRILKPGRTAAQIRRTTFEMYSQRWLAGRKPDIKEATWVHYQRILEVHLAPYFNHWELMQIDREAVKDLKTKLADRKAPRTVNHVLVVLKMILSEAVRDGYLLANPMDGVKRVPVPRVKKIFLRPTQVRMILSQMQSKPDQAIVLCAALGGLREGEIFGLRWPNVDFTKGQIRVVEQHNRFGWGTPKTETSIRGVDMPPILVHALRELPSRFTGDLVFPGKDGQAILPENWLKRVFHPAVRRARIPHVTFHSLRDTYAAMVVMAEKNPKYLQAQMGHASIRTTMDDYGGLFEEANPAAAARLERVFLAESGDKVVTKEQRVGG